MKLSTLKPNPDNPRQIRGERFESLKRSLQADPYMLGLRPIVVDENLVILGGNMRFKALKALGIKELPDDQVIIARDLTEEQKRRFIVLDNSPFGDWDFDMLANAFDDLPLNEWIEGLPVDDLDAAGGPGEEDESDAAAAISVADELQMKWKTEPGQLWALGNHRLICGRCDEPDTLDRLITGKAAVMLTDPPYGINLDKGFGGSRAFGGGSGKTIPSRQYSDDWDSERPDAGAFFLILDRCEKAIIFGGNFFADLLPPSKHWLVWDKLNTMPTFSDCELAWTNIDRKSVKKYTVLYNGLVGKEKERFHPTQKPVAIMTAILKDYSEPGAAVFDPYHGSGTTLIACEQLGRRCFASELSPSYVAVALERWSKLTGREPALLSENTAG